MSSAKNIPAVMKQTIDLYVSHGCPPGGCTTAILENNLKEAVFRADNETLAHIADILMYCQWEIPGACWGSPDKVQTWMAKKDAERSAKTRG